MVSLKVNYLGLELNNPIVVASSPFTSSVEKLMECERAGAGAVILKSVFEEQIVGETTFLSRYNDYPEAADYLNRFVSSEYLNGHLAMISQAKKDLTIPIIASINCMGTAGQWVNYAKMIEMAGADALELNIFTLPIDIDHTAQELEQNYMNIIDKVTSAVKIPVAVKIGNKFTNILNVAKEIYYRNAKGVVMFNRFFEPDVDINKQTLVSSDIVSSSVELRNTLRTVAFASAQLKNLDIAVSTGVRTGEDAIKSLLVGAKCVQVCSAIYADGFGIIETMKSTITEWATKNGYKSVEDFCGKLSFGEYSSDNSDLFQRVQYMKYFPKE